MDPIMPWIGGEIKVLWNRRGEVLSAQESFERWVKIGDCALPVTHMPKNQSADDGTSLVRHVARECKDGGEVRLYEILGGRAYVAGGSAYLTEKLVGKVSHELNASEEILEFRLTLRVALATDTLCGGLGWMRSAGRFAGVRCNQFNVAAVVEVRRRRAEYLFVHAGSSVPHR